MVQSSTSRRLAIVAGAIATGAALYLLLKEDVIAGKWSDSFILIPSTVILAILSGHLFVGALKEWRTWLSAAAFGRSSSRRS